MAKLFGLHLVELKPGVGDQDFITFFNKVYAPFGARLGWKGSALKVDRGERIGRLAFIWEIDSVEDRDRYTPDPEHISEEGIQLLGPEFDEANKLFDKFVASETVTHYVVQ